LLLTVRRDVHWERFPFELTHLYKNRCATYGYGRAYQESLPTPCRTRCRFSTSLRKSSFNVLRLALVMRITSLMLLLL
jgi:hypothetical protein